MSLSVNNASRTRWTTYIVLGLIFLSLGTLAVLVFQSAATGADAQRKADEFTAALTEAGLPAPSQDQIVSRLGDDGGALCADPGSALQQAAATGALSNGAGGPGSRPVIADDTLAQGAKIAVEVYCPEELDEFVDFLNQLKFADVADQG